MHKFDYIHSLLGTVVETIVGTVVNIVKRKLIAAVVETENTEVGDL